MSDHYFNPFIAEKYGVFEAIIINSFIFWTKTNATKNENFFENRFWFFGTPEYFKKFFPYLSPRQIQYALKNLCGRGALLKGNFNKKAYDKTNWYSLSDDLLIELNLDRTCLQPATTLIRQICSVDQTNLSDGSNKFVRPIPVNKPVIKPDIKTTTTVPTPPVDNFSSSSSFFSEKQKDELLTYKLPTDTRSPELFLENCDHHVGKQKNDLSNYQKFTGLIKILIGCYERQEHFKATGFKKNVITTATIHKIPTKQDIENYRTCIPGYEWVGAHRKIQ